MQFRPLQGEDVSTQIFRSYASKQYINIYQIHSWAINAVLMWCEAKKSTNFISKSGCPNLHALKINKQSSEVYPEVVLLDKLNFFQFRNLLIKIYDILKNNILTCSCWASVENWLLWPYASRSSLLYSGFRYNIELPLQPYKIQLYTFRVQGLAFFLPWFPDY